MISPRLYQFVVKVVTVVWAINFAISIIASITEAFTYSEPEINGIFMGTVGLVVAAGMKKNSDSKES